jgi:uncharacterized membrane protein
MSDAIAENSPRFRRFSVEIGAPPAAVYDAWARVDELPRLSPSVLRVKRIDASHALYETVDALGRQRLWDLRVLEREPGHRLAWRSECEGGAASSGAVELAPLPGGRTRLDVDLDYRPSGLLERIADALGWIDAGIRRDLRRFAHFVEAAAGPPLVESAV